MLTIRNIIAFAIVLFIVFLALWVHRNYRTVTPLDEVGELRPKVDLALEKFTYTETVEGHRRWTLTGDRAGHDLGAGMTTVNNVRMVFYDDDLGEVVLTAQEGRMSGNPPVVDICGDVVVQNAGHYRLYSDNLRYVVENKTIKTDGNVRLVSETMNVMAKGMRFHLFPRKIEFLSNVESFLKTPAEVR